MNTSVQVNLNLKIDNLPDLRKALDALNAYDLLVGVPADDDRTDGGGTNARADYAAMRTKRRKVIGPTQQAVVTNAVLAYIHNNGSPAQNIPARPTLMPGIEDAKNKIIKRLGDGAEDALDGRPTAVEANFMAAGQSAVDAVKLRIRSNTPPPLAKSTLAARRRRGVTRTNTLMDTGQYLNSHTYVIRRVTP